MAPQVRFFDRLKFVGDAEVYQTRAAAEAKKGQYESQGFEARLVEQEGQFSLYTRRVVKEVKVEGEPPPG
jgi:hypothetical protein